MRCKETLGPGHPRALYVLASGSKRHPLGFGFLLTLQIQLIYTPLAGDSLNFHRVALSQQHCELVRKDERWPHLRSTEVPSAFEQYSRVTYVDSLAAYKQQTFILHSSGGWDAPDRGASRSGVWWGALPGSQTAGFSLCHHTREGERELSGVSYIGH